jgi:hypothetical protein
MHISISYKAVKQNLILNYATAPADIALSNTRDKLLLRKHSKL